MSPACPKPTKAGRKSAKQSKHDQLVAYRKKQVERAIMRDAGYCTIHWFKYGKKVPFDEVHHVFSRGQTAGDWRENYQSLLCVCRACHPQPIITPGGSANLGWVEEILRKANEAPINSDFTHYRYEECEVHPH